MTDLEISKALAIAIGWKPEQIIMYEGQEYIGLPVMFYNRPFIKLFDYRFWLVIGPIAEKFDCFPVRYDDERWIAYIQGNENFTIENTPQKAIALAVIGSITP